MHRESSYLYSRADVGERTVWLGLDVADLRHLFGGEDGEGGAAESGHLAQAGGAMRRSWEGKGERVRKSDVAMSMPPVRHESRNMRAGGEGVFFFLGVLLFCGLTVRL